jgi:hypothetical protein
MQCRDFREVADSYLSDELLVETNHDMIAHLEACAECRCELAARREVRTTLRASFTNAEELQIRDHFVDRLRRELRDTATTPAPSLLSRRRAWMVVAACLLMAATLALVVVWQRRQAPEQIAASENHGANVEQMRPTNTPPRPAATDVDADLVLARMSEFAAGDHRDCAIGHRLPDRPIALEDAGRQYDRVYLDLAKAAMSHSGEFTKAIDLVMAHACVFRGRWFGHIVVRYRGRLVSLLVTKLENQNGAELAGKKLPKGAEAQVIACSTAAGYRISCFRTVSHAVFVVSDLEEAENLALAREMAPSVYEHITRAEDIS